MLEGHCPCCPRDVCGFRHQAQVGQVGSKVSLCSRHLVCPHGTRGPRTVPSPLPPSQGAVPNPQVQAWGLLRPLSQASLGHAHNSCSPPHSVLPAPVGRCPGTGAPLPTPAAGSGSRGIGKSDHPVTGCFLLSSPSGKWLWSKQAVYLFCAAAGPCSVSPGGTGQWGDTSPFAFLQVEASHLPVVKKGGLGTAWRDQRAFLWEGQRPPWPTQSASLCAR